MDQVQKLDSFVIEDSLNTTPNNLLGHAREIASENARVYGWSISDVRSVGSAIRTGDMLSHKFEVFGIALDSADSSSKSQPGKSATRTDVAAAREIEP